VKLYLCPNCGTSIVETKTPVDALLIAHQKRCGHKPLAVNGTPKTKSGRESVQTFTESGERLADILIQRAGDLLTKGVSDAVKRQIRKRR
jgi:hypothetical protein